MLTKIFINLPVKHLDKSVAFFTGLNFKKNAQFSNDKAACMVVSEEIYVMLLVEEFFKTFTPKGISDASTSTEVILSLSVDSRKDVDVLVEKAIQSGGIDTGMTQEQAGMYIRTFEDLDGHLWEIAYVAM
jgi:predicted lactoylglutathione lyase